MADVSWPVPEPVEQVQVPEQAQQALVEFRSEQVRVRLGPVLELALPELAPVRALLARVQALSLRVVRQEEQSAHPARRCNMPRRPER
jgi:hypothetical protein